MGSYCFGQIGLSDWLIILIGHLALGQIVLVKLACYIGWSYWLVILVWVTLFWSYWLWSRCFGQMGLCYIDWSHWLVKWAIVTLFWSNWLVLHWLVPLVCQIGLCHSDWSHLLIDLAWVTVFGHIIGIKLYWATLVGGFESFL